ncbi:hypothetical protein ACFOE1_09505 [Agromyces mediolanus]|uniref:Dinucleotide-utilizing enzyme n=1 Tax=Agromyces mediolanus TaxID=41986 RepID=A0A918CEI0_AGRME|nr:hypothetical protein [Agromyces mediolanus]GGR19605.1 hypothetical protein GCM10010196_11000 [Agromyces mediolanus]GLJ71284.1 hypothetical protein GCM10017583_05400 [Agromyces mediolanus]
MTHSRPSAAVALVVPTIALAGSAVVTVIGAMWTSQANATLNAALTSGTGTAVDVYGSQSEIVVSSGLLTGGIVGLVVSLALFAVLIGFGALSRRVPAPVLVTEPAESEAVLVEEVVVEEAAPAEPADPASPTDPAAPADPAAPRA